MKSHGTLKFKQRHCPTPSFHTTIDTAVAITEANITNGIMTVPSIPMLVNVAKTPAAGVNPPYMKD